MFLRKLTNQFTDLYDLFRIQPDRIGRQQVFRQQNRALGEGFAGLGDAEQLAREMILAHERWLPNFAATIEKLKA